MAEVMADIEGGGASRLLHGCSPVGDITEQVSNGCLPVRDVDVEVEVEGEDEVSNLEEVVCPHPDHSLHLPVGSFSSDIPSTPGQGFYSLIYVEEDMNNSMFIL